VLNHIRKADREAVKRDLHAIQYAAGIREAQVALGVFARTWKHTYPQALASLLADEEELWIEDYKQQSELFVDGLRF
jgi:transposase-like protein